jgi:transcriptional regulator with XRE-family HTH domain
MQNRFKQLFEAKGITLGKFATLTGTTQGGVSHIVSGRNQPRSSMLARIFEAFPDVNIGWLLTGQGNMYITPPGAPPSIEQKPKLLLDNGETEEEPRFLFDDGESEKESKLLVDNGKTKEKARLLFDNDETEEEPETSKQVKDKKKSTSPSPQAPVEVFTPPNPPPLPQAPVETFTPPSPPPLSQAPAEVFIPPIPPPSSAPKPVVAKSIKRVILFFNDGSFEEYRNN